MKPPTFADVLPVKQLSSHKYALTLEDEWCIGTGKDHDTIPLAPFWNRRPLLTWIPVPNGASLPSPFLVVARLHMTLTHATRASINPINLHLQFLRRTSVGPALFTVQDVKLGARISNLHITLSQKQDPTKEDSSDRKS